MKRLFLVLLAALACLPVRPAMAAGPQLLVEKRDFDFGEVFEGEKVDYTFRFQNAGDEPLIIDRVRSSCGCTAALLSTKIIAVGEVAELKASFDSTRFGGAVVKTIYLYSNDPQQPVAEFHIRGTVKQGITLSPPRVELKNLAVGTTREAVVRLANQSKQPLTITGVQTTAADLAAEVSTKKVAPGETADITVRVTVKEGARRVNGYVMIQTDSPRLPELRLPVSAVVADVGN